MPEPTWVSFPVSAVNVATFQGAYRCDAFYSDDDKNRRVLVLAGKSVYEAFYSTEGIATTLLKQLEDISDLIDVAGFYSPTDKSRHAVISLADLSGQAQVLEFVSHPAQLGVVGQGMLALRMSAFYNPDSHFSHAITLGTNTIYDFVWNLKKDGNNRQLFEVRSFQRCPRSRMLPVFTPKMITQSMQFLAASMEPSSSFTGSLIMMKSRFRRVAPYPLFQTLARLFWHSCQAE